MGYEAIADYYSKREIQPELALGLGQIGVEDQLELNFLDAN